jgi:hypothetical protein
MDPNTTLKQIRELVTRIISYGSDDLDDGEELATLFEALDEWIVNGGFLPKDWKV